LIIGIKRTKTPEEKMRKLKQIKKDAYYLEINEISPIEERTVAETQFIENYLDIINVDIEYVEDIILSTKELIHIITGIIREYDIFKGKTSTN
jgi:hypothetical protein